LESFNAKADKPRKSFKGLCCGSSGCCLKPPPAPASILQPPATNNLNNSDICQPLNPHKSTKHTIIMFQLVLAALLQLSLCLIAEAAPITTQGANWQAPAGGGIVGFIVLVLDIIAWGMSSPS
jgi:hypothetical protein